MLNSFMQHYFVKYATPTVVAATEANKTGFGSDQRIFLICAVKL